MIKLGDYLINQHLKANPGNAYISPDGKALYVLTPNGQTMTFVGTNFNDLTDEEVNRHIVNSLS